MPNRDQLKTALSAAGSAHHDYESKFLKGVRDEMWPGWYAAFVIGCLGDFTTPTELTEWLIEVSFEGDWFENAVELIAERLKK
ncbi:MAG: hypothetical protein AAF633_18915 [Chloroflexota bacterium]